MNPEDAVRQAQAATQVLFGAGPGQEPASIVAKDVISALRTDPRLKLLASADQIIGQPLTKLAADFGLTNSRGEWTLVASVVLLR